MQRKERLSITRMGSRVICLETFGTKVRLDLVTEISQAHSWRTLAYVVLNLYNEMDRLRARGKQRNKKDSHSKVSPRNLKQQPRRKTS